MSTTLLEGVPQPRPMSAEFALCAQFASAKGAFDKAPNQTQKLKLYSLFKYVTVGPCEESGIPRPGMLQFTERAKYDSWRALGASASAADAERDYIALVAGLCPDWRARAETLAREKRARAEARMARDAANDAPGGAGSAGGDGGGAGAAEEDDGYDYSSDEVDGPSDPGMLGVRMSRFLMDGTEEGADDAAETGPPPPQVVKLALEGDLDALKALIGNAPADKQAELAAITNESGLNALLAAVDRSHGACVDYLLETRLFDLNVRDAEGNTALHFAAWCENASVYRALLAAGADAEVVDNDGNTPSAVMSTAFRNKVADGA